MGFLSSLSLKDDPSLRQWRHRLGQDKEESATKPTFPKVRGGSWGRSAIAEPAAYKRLLQAMRSMAPGGWTDDRWEETKHFVGIQYICFPAGTRVRMADGAYKNIEQIHLRDEVLTAEGNVRSVTHCFMHRHEGELINLNLWGHRHLQMTPEHPVLTKRGYVPAADLLLTDFVALPRYMPERISVLQTSGHVVGEAVQTKAWHAERSCGRGSKEYYATGGEPWTVVRKVPDFINLDPDFGMILGLYLAEAHTTDKGEVTWSFDANKEKDTLVPKLVGLLEKFGFTPRIASPKSNPSVVQVHICGKLWVRLFRSLCGKGASAKKLHTDVLAGPDDFLGAVLDGWLAGDGCLERGKYRVGATVSHDLALNMFDIGNHLGLRPTILRQEPQQKAILGQRLGRHLPVWKVFFRATGDNYRVQMDKTHVWRKVESLERETFSGDVFNIEVVGDNSYVAEGIGVHNCIHRSGEQLAQGSFTIKEKNPNEPNPEEWKPASGPGAEKLMRLLEEPNHDDCFGDLLYQWNQQLDLTGMALTWMVPNVLGTPYELYTVPTAVAIPQPAINPDYPDGYYRIQPLYPYGPFSSYPTPATAVGAPIPAQWMLRFKYAHPLVRYDGYSPLTAMKLHLDEVEAMDRSRWYSMKRTIQPSAVLNFEDNEGMEPLPEPEIERIKAEFEGNFQGPENVGQLFVSAPGSKLEEWGKSPKEMEYYQSWDQLVAFCMAGFGITKPAAGMVEDASYSTLFATLKQLHLLTLKPKASRIARQLTRHLAQPFFGENLVVLIELPKIDDHDVKRANVETIITAKAATKNEVRKELGFHTTTQPWGEDVAGDPSPLEQEQNEQGAQESPNTHVTDESIIQTDGAGRVRELERQFKPEEEAKETREEPKESSLGRPRTHNLGRGSLGPRKHLGNGYDTKSLREERRLRKAVLTNGHR